MCKQLYIYFNFNIINAKAQLHILFIRENRLENRLQNRIENRLVN